MAARGLQALIERSAAPGAVATAVARLVEAHPGRAGRLDDDPAFARAAVAVLGASRAATRLLERDPVALELLSDLDHRPLPDRSSPEALASWKSREQLRLMARDLLGADGFEATVAGISSLAVEVLDAAVELAGGEADALAVVAMGKLGGAELNYASDLDVVFVADDAGPGAQRAARLVVAVAGRCYRIDTALRPEGRNGPLVRTLDGFTAHWERWAEPWERQALLKARPVAGNVDLGRTFATATAEVLWQRPFDAEDLRSVRAMKDRTEADAVRRGDGDREIKRGSGGVRDIEFAAQLLQLVHGQHDPSLRVRATLAALAALADGGYIDDGDAGWLRSAYRFLRRVEHALQLVEDRPVRAVPADGVARAQLARVLGFRDRPAHRAVDELDEELAACRATVRQVHERLYFRPLLEAFAGVDGPLGGKAASTRLAAFGFTDADRTRQAVAELTRGLTRSSRLMQQMMPLLLDWLSASPDPDSGLLGLRRLASGGARATMLATAFRDSPETARRLCTLLGTSRHLTALLARNPDLIESLGRTEALRPRSEDELTAQARAALAVRVDGRGRQRALHRFADREGLRIAAHDVLGLSSPDEVGGALSALAQSVVRIAVEEMEPAVPFTVVALGRFGGGELSYASDLDLVFVHDGAGDGARAEADRVADGISRWLRGDTPVDRIYAVDLDLRPEGRSGPLVRSLEGYRAHVERWAAVWERQALLRARPVAGDAGLGARFLAALEPLVWRPVDEADRREVRRIKARIEAERVPPKDDPAFHLKLGPGALADVEFCAQLLQLVHRVPSAATQPALEQLAAQGHLDPADAEVLAEAYRFCERTRNRWSLLRGARADALPTGDDLTRLARSLGTTAPALRDEYRRVTRRSRRVVERVFYGRP